MEPHYITLAIHVVVGFILVFFSLKAYRKTKYPPMALLAVGFALIVLGDTVIGDLLDFITDTVTGDVIEELIEISGFIVLILAVKRS
jgi:hypothetical protein